MGHGNDGAGVVLERAFQPGDRLGVEMVGGLVEEEVGLGEEETGHGDTSNLAAGKVLNAPVAGWGAEGIHCDLDRALEIPGTGGFDLGFEVGLLGTEFLVVSVGIAPGGEHLVVLGEHCRCVARTVHHVFEDGLRRIELGFLLQHADRVALAELCLTGVVGVDAGHDLEQCRFAGAVRAEHADFAPGKNESVMSLITSRFGGMNLPTLCMV